MIRLPVHAGEALTRLQKAKTGLELKLGRSATVQELAVELDLPEDKVREILGFAVEPVSLSQPVREEVETELGELVENRSGKSPFEAAVMALLPSDIRKVLSPLEEQERQILVLHFGLDRGEPRTLVEVGQCLYLTPERVCQIEVRAMSKLRHPSSITGARGLLAS